VKNKSIIFFDGICTLCNKTVLFILKHETNKLIYFSSLQSKFAQDIFSKKSINIEEFNSIIFIENNCIYYKSQAVFRISKNLKFPFNLLKYFRFLPVFITDFIYDIIAENRYRIFGKIEQCQLLTESDKKRFLVN